MSPRVLYKFNDPIDDTIIYDLRLRPHTIRVKGAEYVLFEINVPLSPIHFRKYICKKMISIVEYYINDSPSIRVYLVVRGCLDK